MIAKAHILVSRETQEELTPPGTGAPWSTLSEAEQAPAAQAPETRPT